MADESEIQRLIGLLRDFRTRREARQQLLRMGADVVEAFIDLLNDRDEALAWCAAQSLGDLGDPRAVGPLIDCLRRGRLAGEVADSLSQITGEDFGQDAEKWAGWAEKTPMAAMTGSGAPVQSTMLTGPEDLLQQVVNGTDMTLAVRGDSFRVTVPLKHDRSQKVDVLFSLKDPDGDDLVVVYSECGPANKDYYESVLRRNVRVPYGAYGIRDVGGKPTFVMFNTTLRRTVGVEQLRKVIRSVAKRADAVEKALTGEDER